jgi:hypothetical protein
MFVPPARRVLLHREEDDNDGLTERREDRFFRTLRLRNGTYKTTGRGRLTAIDALAFAHLPAERPLRLLDVGISSGVTTVDWTTTLGLQGIAYTAVAADLVMYGRLCRLFGVLDVLVDRTGFAMQLALASMAFGRPHAGVTSSRGRLLDWLFRSVESRIPPEAGQEVAIVSRALSRNRAVERVEWDLTQQHPAWLASFSVVRAANVLNRAYFEEPVLRRMAEFVWSYLEVGGILIAVRTTDEGVHHATIAQRRANGSANIVATLGDGADILPFLPVER